MLIMAPGTSKNGIGIITSQIGKGSSPHSGSSFFPAAQRSKIKSELTQSGANMGKTFRSVRPELQSVILTNFYRRRGWIGSPYEANMAISVKRKEGLSLAKLIQR
jgi:hypothetical protein